MLLISPTAFSQDRTSFIIAKSEIHDSYMLCAIFDKNVTSKILESVNYYMIKNNRLFMKRTFQEKTLILADKTTFHVTIKPGELRINFRKTDNTLGRYDTLKSRCNNMEEKINEASGYEETISNIKELSIVDNPVP